MSRVLAIMMVLMVCGVTTAATLNVPSPYPTVQEAINAAQPGDTVLVAPGTYTGTGDWVINPLGKPITIRATGTPEETVIDSGGFGGGRVVQCSSGEGADTIIEGFTITGGSEGYGGGIYCSGGSSPTITDCTISGNYAWNVGGGIYCSNSSSPTISGCTISGNSASNGWPDGYASGGGIYCYDSSPTISDCVISNNSVHHGFLNGNASGGGIRCSGGSNPTITDCTISDNTAIRGGGIFCSSSSSPTIIDCTISGNTASDGGGGMYCSSSSSPTLTDTVVCGNDPDQIVGSVDDNGGNCIEDDCYDCEFHLPDEPEGQDEEPEYGDYTPPSPEVNKLVIVTHGIRTGENDFLNGGWGMQLVNAIDTQSDDDWSVYAFYYGNLPDPWRASFVGRLFGTACGTVVSEGTYEHVHLIGHSAGAYFLDACSSRIKALSPEKTVHLTYLDPAGVYPISDVLTRGYAADFAENYFSRSGLVGCGWAQLLEAPFTQHIYDQCFNIDVSQLDPDYDDDCLSSHGWPHCFYRLSADADVDSDADCDVINGNYESFGFGLSLANFSNDVDTWLDTVSQYHDGDLIELPPEDRGSSGDEEYIVFEHFDDPLNLEDSMNYEYEGSVAIYWSEDSVALSASDYGGTSWINVELIPTKPTNIVKLRLAPGAVGAAVGLTTVLLDGEQIGIVDERHIPGEGDTYVFGMQRIAPPGEPLILSIRLDTFAAGDASMTASSIQIGHSDIRWHCLSDLTSVGGGQGNLDGMVDHADLDVILGEWGTFCAADCAQSACPGDIDFDCRVGVLDLLELLMSWGDCE